MTAYQIIDTALREGWTCERVADELTAIGLTKAQISEAIKQEIFR